MEVDVAILSCAHIPFDKLHDPCSFSSI